MCHIASKTLTFTHKPYMVFFFFLNIINYSKTNFKLNLPSTTYCNNYQKIIFKFKILGKEPNLIDNYIVRVFSYAMQVLVNNVSYCLFQISSSYSF